MLYGLSEFIESFFFFFFINEEGSISFIQQIFIEKIL